MAPYFYVVFVLSLWCLWFVKKALDGASVSRQDFVGMCLVLIDMGMFELSCRWDIRGVCFLVFACRELDQIALCERVELGFGEDLFFEFDAFFGRKVSP